MKIIINISSFSNLKANKLENVANEGNEKGILCLGGRFLSIGFMIKSNDKPLMSNAILVCVDYHHIHDLEAAFDL